LSLLYTFQGKLGRGKIRTSAKRYKYFSFLGKTPTVRTENRTVHTEAIAKQQKISYGIRYEATKYFEKKGGKQNAVKYPTKEWRAENVRNNYVAIRNRNDHNLSSGQ
jgi:hypothetical protein